MHTYYSYIYYVYLLLLLLLWDGMGRAGGGLGLDVCGLCTPGMLPGCAVPQPPPPQPRSPSCPPLHPPHIPPTPPPGTCLAARSIPTAPGGGTSSGCPWPCRMQPEQERRRGGAVAGPPLGPPVPPQPRLDAAKVTPRRLQLPGGAGHRPPPGPGWMGGPGGPSDGRRQSSSLPGVLLLGRIFLFLHIGPGVSWPRNA